MITIEKAKALPQAIINHACNYFLAETKEKAKVVLRTNYPN